MSSTIAEKKLYCECGSALTLYTLYPQEAYHMEHLFNTLHLGHEKVNAYKAHRVRWKESDAYQQHLARKRRAYNLRRGK